MALALLLLLLLGLDRVARTGRLRAEVVVLFHFFRLGTGIIVKLERGHFWSSRFELNEWFGSKAFLVDACYYSTQARTTKNVKC